MSAIMNLTHLDDRIKRMQNIKPLLDQIGQDQTKSTVDNFQAGGRPNRWAPLAFESLQNAYRGGNSIRKNKKKTMKSSRGGKTLTSGFSRYASGKKTLVDTGILMNSIDYRSTSNISQTGVLSGPAKAYAGVHQFGNSKKNIPARPFLVLLPGDRDLHNHSALIHWRGTAS